MDSIQSQSPEHSSRGMTKLVASAPWAVSHLRVSRPRRVCACMGYLGCGLEIKTYIYLTASPDRALRRCKYMLYGLSVGQCCVTH